MSAKVRPTASLSFVVQLRENASDQEKIAFLLQRDLERQRDFTELRETFLNQQAAIHNRLSELERALLVEMDEREAEHRGQRLWGTMLLVVGLTLSLLASLR